MKKYFVDDSGRCHGECGSDAPVNPDGFDVITHDEVVGSPFEYRLDGGVLVYFPLGPVPTLDQVKSAKNTEINAARAEANSRTFLHDGREFSCDALSRSDIDGINGYIALNGGFPPQFPSAWKTINNAYYPLPNVESWKAFYASMVATGAANFAHTQALKDQLASANTIEEVKSIAW